MRGVKELLGNPRILALFLISLIVISSAQPILVRADESESTVPSLDDKNRVIMLYMVSMTLSSTPLNTSAKYELFHTVYTYRNGTLILNNSPYIPGEELEQSLPSALEARKLVENGTVTTFTNETGVYMNYNGTISDAILYSNNKSWDMHVESLYNNSLNNNTIIYWGNAKANLSGYIAEYNVIYLVANISDTHKVYITTVMEKLDNTSYGYVYTDARYWFKDKNTFFGDWIVLPEGAESLSQYYERVADAVQFLYNDVYKGSSPGYVPTSYPQIAKYLNILSKNIPEGYNLRVVKGYALVTDIVWTVIAARALAGATLGAIGYTIAWAVTTGCDIKRWNWYAFACSVAFSALTCALGACPKLTGGYLKLGTWLKGKI